MTTSRRPFQIDRSWMRGAGQQEAPEARQLCQLKMAKSCCGGKGYQVTPDGPTAVAHVCSCVQECPTCYGRAHYTEGNHSTPCRTPSPSVVAGSVNAAMIPARYSQATLTEFANFTGNGRRFLQDLHDWRERFQPVGSPGLLITGPVGVGKTYVLAALARDFAERGYSVRFTDFFQLLGELRAGFSEGKADSSQLAPLIDVDVLFIDEMGKGRNKDWDKTVLDQLVSGRYNRNKTIVATTNFVLTQKRAAHAYNVDLDRQTQGSQEFAPDTFGTLEARVGARIFSRLREMTRFLDLSGEDFRAKSASYETP